MSQICEQATGLEDMRFWEEFSSHVQQRRVPFSGSLALTHRCNLGCIHCYAKDEHEKIAGHSELSAGQWQRIIGEIKEAGCLYLLLTGGEPMVRDDFPEIYSFAKENGFLVTVFTNGTLIDDRILHVFHELPPRLVEVSLLGACAQTHDRITGRAGSFAKTLSGVQSLLGQGVNVRLKSVLMTLNADEFPAIEELARSLGVKFRLDAAIFPSLAGDRGPLDLRVPPERAVTLEMADSERANEWRDFFARYKAVPYGNKVFACNAGKTNFHVDPDGYLFPCLIARSRRYSLRNGSFQEGWTGEIARIHEEEIADDYPCGDCENKTICGFCPGFFELEHGQARVPSAYICAIGRLRREAIANERHGG